MRKRNVNWVEKSMTTNFSTVIFSDKSRARWDLSDGCFFMEIVDQHDTEDNIVRWANV